jgi:hypothetical protein
VEPSSTTTTSSSGHAVVASTDSVVIASIAPSLRVGMTTLNRPGTYAAPAGEDRRCTADRR